MDPIGIAIATYERRERLEALLDTIVALTDSPYELVVADDGSSDGTPEWCRSRTLRVVTGSNRGVAWNKNRGLFALSLLGCDPMLVLEDDVYPVERGWEHSWIEGTRRWHHLAYMHPKIEPFTVSGAGTAEDPFLNEKATAQCMSVSAHVLAQIGFLDSRFKGWGHEHAEWTSRIRRAGYGFKEFTRSDGATARANLYLSGGLEANDAPSFRDNAQVRVNLEIYRRISRDPPFRYPWTDEDERTAFLAEQRAGGLQPDLPGPDSMSPVQERL